MNKENSKLIISICSTDVIYCVSVYKKGDKIITPYAAIGEIYYQLGIPVKVTGALFLNALFCMGKEIYIFSQGPVFWILYLRNIFKIIKKKVFYSECYLRSKQRELLTVESMTIGENIHIKSYLPLSLQKFLRLGVFSDGGYTWIQCFTFMDPLPTIDIRQYGIKCKGELVILDEILIDYPDLLDFERISKSDNIIVKRKSRKGGGWKLPDDKLKYCAPINGKNIVPLELWSGYKFILGYMSTALKLERAVSLEKIVDSKFISASTYKPESLTELYELLDS